ncbi:MAG: T9SS type A sorting domain-containing protein [Bacteroidales bacterium]|nr:T9SS type A sorting domain-containing protein [Bacteroidales bacterium]
MIKKIPILIILSIFVSLIINSQQIENPGFEDWEEIGLGPDIIEPVNWSTLKTSDDPDYTNIAPITWERSTEAHNGQYSVKLSNVSALGIPVPGTITNGRFHPNFNTDLAYIYTDTSDPQWYLPYSHRPDSIAFWMKFFPVDGDTLQFQALLHVGEGILPVQNGNHENWVGYTRADIGGTFENWTRIVLPFEYYDNRTPEYLLVILTSGNGTTPVIGSYAYFDDIEIIGGQQAIAENPLNNVDIVQLNNKFIVNNLPPEFENQSYLEIIDLTGRILMKEKIRSGRVTNTISGELSGLYIIKVITADYSISRKMVFN